MLSPEQAARLSKLGGMVVACSWRVERRPRLAHLHHPLCRRYSLCPNNQFPYKLPLGAIVKTTGLRAVCGGYCFFEIRQWGLKTWKLDHACDTEASLHGTASGEPENVEYCSATAPSTISSCQS